MNGFLVVDKPGGITSHDVIARCRKMLGTRRIGHAGTLDPMATGVLIIGVGRATRLLRFVEDLDKEYRAGVRFGAATSTQDAQGEVLEERDASGLDAAALEAILPRFRGAIEQVPPMVSALKVDGERLYEKARRGEVVERAARLVTVAELEVESFTAGARAHATIRVRCTKGTYVRTLAADIGEALGVLAHLDALRRTRVGPHRVEDAVPVDLVTPDKLRRMDDAVAGYPRRDVDEDEARALIQGRGLPAAGITGPYAVFGPDGLIAMVQDGATKARSLCVMIGQE